MPKGYWLVLVDVEDPDSYAEYVKFVRPFLERIGGKFLARGGQNEVTEGNMRARKVIIEFDSYQAAVDAYHSAEYQHGMTPRRTASQADFAILEGL